MDNTNFAMTNLSVNINKVATIRNARGANTPNVARFAVDCEAFGADGITVHPRLTNGIFVVRMCMKLNLCFIRSSILRDILPRNFYNWFVM